MTRSGGLQRNSTKEESCSTRVDVKNQLYKPRRQKRGPFRGVTKTRKAETEAASTPGMSFNIR